MTIEQEAEQLACTMWCFFFRTDAKHFDKVKTMSEPKRLIAICHDLLSKRSTLWRPVQEEMDDYD